MSKRYKVAHLHQTYINRKCLKIPVPKLEKIFQQHGAPPHFQNKMHMKMKSFPIDGLDPYAVTLHQKLTKCNLNKFLASYALCGMRYVLIYISILLYY